MKNICLIVITLFGAGMCRSQDVVNRKKNVTLTVTEKYHTVIETDKEVKQGLCQAFYRKTLIAAGMYTNDKKTGVWLFYDKNGQAVEKYNYDTHTLVGELPDDSTSSFNYRVDEKLKSTDIVTKPVKIGGRYYGYVPYLKLFKLPPNADVFRHIIMELLISPGGRLAGYKIHLRPGADDQAIDIDPDLLTDEEKTFIPATINGIGVTCRIFIYCHINQYDELDTD